MRTNEIKDEEEIARLRAEVRQTNGFHGIYARDRRMLRVIEAIRRVAATQAAVLICGESGTGKQLVAQAVHMESPRAAGPFVAFHAAALPETLAEAELFGREKGAHTGADRDSTGLFLKAHGGTLLIDEVSTMPAGLQGKLLRALQQRETLPLGSGSAVQADVRVVATTNLDPRRLLREEKLRQDLYYRLAVMPVAVPPLRERIEDIPLLANVFLERLVPAGQLPRSLSPRALRLLISHDWPGNVRELQNVIERAALISCGDEIGPADIVFEDDFEAHPDSLDYEEAKREALERFQRRYIEDLMATCDGNISAAARRASMTRAALYRILKRLGLASDSVAAVNEEQHEPNRTH
ncbi:MAG: sigma 54-interacting transcriptional regulator, partial [Acidobacteria bacterium]|nr:sigma 54-interacting transcriptional regulator [Acidobacteriota bacterium]